MKMGEGETNPVATEIIEMTKRLRLPHLRRNFYDLCTTAKAQRWDPIELVRVLLEAEINGRNATVNCHLVACEACECKPTSQQNPHRV